MKRVRIIGFLVILATAIGIGVRASYLNVEGRPQQGTSIALGITLLVLNLAFYRPALRPPRPPAITVTHPDAAPGDVYGHDAHDYEYTRDRAGRLYRYTEAGPVRMPPPPLPPHWWNGPARVLLVLGWLVRAALAGYASYFVSLQLDRGFNLRMLEFAVAAQVLFHLRRILRQLAGFRLDWAGYRGWAAVRKLANAVVTALLAGYAFVVAALLEDVITAIPRGIYRGLDHLWHLPWLNIPIVVVASVIAFVILAAVVSWLQGRIARALGPDSALGAKLDELRLIKWTS